MKPTLIVYYSRSGRTRWVAEQLAAALDADVAEIVERKDRSGVLGYLGAGKDAMLKRESDLASSPSLDGRTAVILGMPVWAFGPPPPMRTWLSRADLAGKTVLAFCTMDGSGSARTFKALRKIVPQGLADTLDLVKPGPSNVKALARIREWAARAGAMLRKPEVDSPAGVR